MTLQELKKDIDNRMNNAKSADEQYYIKESFGTLYDEIMESVKSGNELLNISSYLFEQAHACGILHKYGIKKFAYSAMSSASIEQLYNFVTFGYKIAGVTTVKNKGSENPAVLLECA